MSTDPGGARDGAGGEEQARLLFRHVTGEEWREYRSIMGIFAGTFFSEFTPEEVGAALSERGVELDPGIVAERLESLRRWGNLTVSSATGSPGSLADYYRRRNRYLITRAGQEVHDAVEAVLSRVDEVRDVSTGRLRALLGALLALERTDLAGADSQQLGDLVRAVFDPHEAFTSEITQFFAALNQWQSRYDLSAEEFSFFAQVLVGYVAERIGEIERLSRPIAATLGSLAPRIPVVVERANRGLAARVEEAGLEGSVSVARAAGTSLEDWDHLAGWFLGRNGRPARMDQLRRDAVAAIRSLTLNLTRLSRVGFGSSSRRADLLRLAGLIANEPDADAPALLNAALGMFGAEHWGAPASDAGDPVASTTSWWEAPVAEVPVSLRERGDTTARGRTSPVTDRSAEQEQLRRRRRQQLDALARVDAELLAGGLPERPVSEAALARFEQLVGRALAAMPVRGARAEVRDGALACTVERAPGALTTVSSGGGRLRLFDLVVTLAPLGAGGAGASGGRP